MGVLDWIKRFSSQRSLAKVVDAVEQNLGRFLRAVQIFMGRRVFNSQEFKAGQEKIGPAIHQHGAWRQAATCIAQARWLRSFCQVLYSAVQCGLPNVFPLYPEAPEVFAQPVRVIGVGLA